jgi:hypothetical protein
LDADIREPIHPTRGLKIGIGDELMVSARVRRLQAADPRKVRVLDRHGGARWHPVWEGNPRIARQTETGDLQIISDGPGCRPYIAEQTTARWIWRERRNEPGELYLTDAERAFGARLDPQIVIEPHVKPRATPNKRWPLERWKQLVRFVREEGCRVTQVGAAGTPRLSQADFIETPDFRQACAVLARARAFVGPACRGGVGRARGHRARRIREPSRDRVRLATQFVCW